MNRRFNLAAAGLATLGLVYFVLHPAFAFGRIPQMKLLFLSLFQRPPPPIAATWASIATHLHLRAVLYATLALALCALHWCAFRAASRASPNRAPWIAIGFAGASLIFVIGLPIHSTDVFTYLATAEITDVQELDPYTARPRETQNLASPGHNVFPGSRHASIYGPLATRLFSWLYLPTLGVAWNLVLWKAFLAGLMGLAIGVLWDCWKLQGRTPEQRLALLVMLAWSPLVLSEVALHGHVDTLAVILVALGAHQFLRGRETLGLILIAATISVKISFAVLLPAILARAVLGAPTLPRGLLRATLVLVGAIAFSGLWLFLGRPYGNPLSAVLEIGGTSVNSLTFVIKRWLPQDARHLVVPIMRLALCVFLAFRLRSLRDRDAFFPRLTRDYVLYLTVFGQLFYQWYVLPALALGSLSSRERQLKAIAWLAAAALVVLPTVRLVALRDTLWWLVQLPLVLVPATVLLLAPERRNAS